MQEATCCTPSLPGSPEGRAQWKACRKAVHSESKAAGSQQRPCSLKLQHLQRHTHRGSAADGFSHSPGRICLLSYSHSAMVALEVSQKPCSEQSILACFPQLHAARWAGTRTGLCPALTVLFSACCVSMVDRQGGNQHLVWAELILCYKQNKSCPTTLLSSQPSLVQHQSRQVTVSNRWSKEPPQLKCY